jgi:hypothetical protein
MGTELLEDAYPAMGVTKRYKFFAQQLDTHRWAIGFGKLP